jgi:hypothetical protein
MRSDGIIAAPSIAAVRQRPLADVDYFHTALKD